MLPQLREGVLWEMGRHLPPSPTNFSACRPSPSSSQDVAGRGVAVPHRTVEKQRDGASGEAVIKSFKAFYKPQKSLLMTQLLSENLWVDSAVHSSQAYPRSQMNPFHFPFPVKPCWPFLFHWPCLIATPNQLYHSTEVLLLKGVLGQQNNQFCSFGKLWACSALSEPLFLGITQLCLGSCSGC